MRHLLESSRPCWCQVPQAAPDPMDRRDARQAGKSRAGLGSGIHRRGRTESSASLSSAGLTERVSSGWISEGTSQPRGPQDQAKPAINRPAAQKAGRWTALTLALQLGNSCGPCREAAPPGQRAASRRTCACRTQSPQAAQGCAVPLTNDGKHATGHGLGQDGSRHRGELHSQHHACRASASRNSGAGQGRARPRMPQTAPAVWVLAHSSRAFYLAHPH